MKHFIIMGNTIRIAREGKGLSQEQISLKLKFKSPQYISNIERGMASLPVKHFKPVSKLLGIKLDTLVTAWIDDEHFRILKELGLK